MENEARLDGEALSESAPEVEKAGSGETAGIAGADCESGEGVACDPEGFGEETSAESAAGGTASAKPRIAHVRVATIVGLVLVVVLGGLTGWLGYRAFQSHQGDEQRNLFLQVGRQGALNLTTIDWQHADTDVQRILDSATGTFYDDFQKRSGPFIEVVKQAQSKSEGKVTEAGLESRTDNEGQVLVAVTVNTSNAGAPEQQPRSWRMRITVQKVNEDAKVSKVEFVP
ncbi:mammalian cell entry protein [Mycobacterium avium subsp. hominissuis 10-5606]|nr:mammalian cell entry protein [Mycobacterium avium subsp. hominissuis 10-5606]